MSQGPAEAASHGPAAAGSTAFVKDGERQRRKAHQPHAVVNRLERHVFPR